MKALKYFKTFDIIVIIFLLIASVLYGKINKYSNNKTIVLTVENKTKVLKFGHYKYNLNKDFHKNITIEIDNRKARFIHSDCMNKICIKTGWIEKCGESSVCLPNKTAIQIKCEENDIDGISR